MLPSCATFRTGAPHNPEGTLPGAQHRTRRFRAPQKTTKPVRAQHGARAQSAAQAVAGIQHRQPPSQRWVPGHRCRPVLPVASRRQHRMHCHQAGALRATAGLRQQTADGPRPAAQASHRLGAGPGVQPKVVYSLAAPAAGRHPTGQAVRYAGSASADRRPAPGPKTPCNVQR